MVRAHPKVTGVYHCYSGSLEDAKTLVKLGWMLSFTGVVTYKNARRSLEVIDWLPMDRIMIETDAPYMAPEPHRGKRNDSSLIPHAAAKIAQLRGVTTREVLKASNQNIRRLFRLEGRIPPAPAPSPMAY